MIIESTTFDYHEKRDDNSNVFGTLQHLYIYGMKVTKGYKMNEKMKK